MKKLLLGFLHVITFPSIVFNSFGQTPTVGLRFHDDLVTEGYTLFTPEKNTNVYLINDCGEKVNEWNFTDRPSLTAYILENGNMRPLQGVFVISQDFVSFVYGINKAANLSR